MIRPSYIGALSSQRTAPEVITERNITGAAAQSPVAFDYNTSWAAVEASLPSLIVTTLDDGTQAPLGIDWIQGTYNPVVANTYSISGNIELLTGITNSTNIHGAISVTVNPAVTYDVFVATTGHDTNNTGLTIGSPLLTISAGIAKAVSLGGARTVKFASGTYTLTAFQTVPINISLAGAGIDVTYFKGDASLNFTANIPAFQWGFDKYLFNFTSGATANGNQTVRDITFDGDNRAKHGAIYVLNRNNVTFKNIKVNKFNFAGLYFISTDNLQILDSTFIDNSASEQVVSTGAITCGHNTNTLIDNLDMNEGRGYGIKAFGPAPVKPIVHNMRILNSSISVFPTSAYGGGGISNIAIELHDTFLANCEIAYNYVDSSTSVVTAQAQTPSYQGSAVTARIHHNEMNMIARGNGFSYCIESALHNVEIYNNYLYGGQHAAIVSWNQSDQGQPAKQNWLIHSNVIHGQTSFFPVYYIRTRYTPLANLRVINNTFHNTAATAIYVVGSENGMNNSNWTFRNNVVLDEKTGTVPANQGGANRLIELSGGGSIANLVVSNNCIFGMPVGSIPGGTYSNNLTVSPQLTKSGVKPDPYYRPLPTSPLIEAGANVGLPFIGAAPTIGAYSITDVVDTGDIVAVETLSALSISTGVPWATVRDTLLPATMTVTLDDASQVILAVTWAQGTYNSAVEDTYNIIGTLTLVTGVTNTGNLTATIAVTVTAATVYFTDSFNRGSLGSNYTIQGNVTASLDGSDMTLGLTTAGGVTTDRIVRNTWDGSITEFRSAVIFTPSELTASSWGLGVGIQNPVSPNPNQGVYMNFHTALTADQGKVWIYQGDNTLSNSNFILRATSNTQLTLVQDRQYLMEFDRRISGADLLFTVKVTDLVTDNFVTAQWVDVGSSTLTYASTQQQALYNIGGAKVVEDWTVYNLGVVTSTVLVDDIFDRTVLTPWTEVDLANELTVTMNNPYVTLTSAVYAPSRMIVHPTQLGTLLQSWRMTVDFRFTAGAGGGLLIGTKNQPVNPNVNRAVLTRIDQSASKLSIHTGGGTTSDDTYNQQNLSSGSMTFTNNVDYRVVLERTYNGSGNAVYLSTVYRISTPGTTITSTYTSTNAPEQALYASTKWSLSVMGNTVQVRRVLIEEL